MHPELFSNILKPFSFLFLFSSSLSLPLLSLSLSLSFSLFLSPSFSLSLSFPTLTSLAARPGHQSYSSPRGAAVQTSQHSLVPCIPTNPNSPAGCRVRRATCAPAEGERKRGRRSGEGEREKGRERVCVKGKGGGYQNGM